ncbi:sensor histidine kinase [Thermodesulfobacteriota bacterium B35]
MHNTYLSADEPARQDSCQNLRQLLLTFHDVTKLINSELDKEQLIHTILAMVTRVMGADNALLLHNNGAPGRMQEISTIGTWPLDVNLFSSIGLEHAAHCLVQHEGFIRPQELLPADVYQALTAGEQQFLQTVLSAPMETKGRVTGMIFIAAPQRQYEKIELEVFCALASQAAIALENAALHERLRQKLVMTREELRHTQAELIRSEKIASIVEMAMGVAHSIRNPVMSMGGLARQLARELRGDPGVEKKLAYIIQGTDRLEKIVGEFAKFASQDSFSPVRGDIIGLAAQALRHAAGQERAAGVEFSLEPDKGEMPCRHDPLLLRRVFDEVIANSLDVLGGSGRISIRLRPEGQFVRIDISDTGPGIPEDQLGLIFDPFYTTRTRSTGLGLTYVHRIIERHDGTIEVTSVPDQGTTFTIRIPGASRSGEG